MPIKLITESADVQDVDLLTTDGELTLEAEVVSDFLTHADFEKVFEADAARDLIVAFDESGKLQRGRSDLAEQVKLSEGFDENLQDGYDEFMLGEHAAALVDVDDLIEMFAHYADQLPDVTLEDKTRLAAVGAMLGLTEKYARGAFKKMARTKVGHAKVARMMLGMLNKGSIKRVGSGKGYQGGGYDKGAAYKKAKMVKASAKAKIAKYKKANVSKMKKAARAARVKVKEDTLASFGFGVPVAENHFEVGVRDGAAAPKVAESTERPASVVAESRVPLSGPALVAKMRNLSESRK